MSAAPGPVFVDTHVLLHAVDDLDKTRQERARQWLAACWTRRAGRLSTQVLNEYYANARQRFAASISAQDARADVRRYQQWRPWQIDPATVDTAWAVESRFGLSYRDALMIAAAQHMGCTIMLTEALQHGWQLDGVRVVNPFLAGPDILEQPAT